MPKRPPTKTSFTKGNQASKGVKKPMTGRPPDHAKRALRDLLLAPDDKDPSKRSLYDQARDTLREVLRHGKTAQGAGAAIRAVGMIFEYVDGPPPQEVKASGELRVTLAYDD